MIFSAISVRISAISRPIFMQFWWYSTRMTYKNFFLQMFYKKKLGTAGFFRDGRKQEANVFLGLISGHMQQYCRTMANSCKRQKHLAEIQR